MNTLTNNWPPRRFRQIPSILHSSRLQGLFDTTMAAAMQTVPASEEDAVRLCSCGNKISCKDTHQVCSACLGLKHAQMAIENPGSCEHCARFPMKSLRRRLARQANLSGHDPLMSPSPVPAATSAGIHPCRAAHHGSFIMGWTAWHLRPSAQRASARTRKKTLLISRKRDNLTFFSLKKRKISRTLLSSPLCIRHNPSQRRDPWKMQTGQPSPLLSVDLQDVCKRAAEKLNIPWPTVVAETAKSRYEGKRLLRAKRAARQLLPVFPELLDELAVTWKDKPFTSKLPMQGGSALDVEAMEKAGLLQTLLWDT